MNRNISVHLSRSALVTLTERGLHVEMDEEAPRAEACRGLAQSTGPGSPPAIGQPWPGQGGVYAGLMRGETGKPDYHLIVPTDAKANLANLEWGGYRTDSKCTSEVDGLYNTAAMLIDGHDHPVLKVCKDVTIDGHSDFYLPSRRELSLCFANVRELFETDDWFWSSTQYDGDDAWSQDFHDGNQGWSRKYSRGRARAVRRVPA